MVKILFVCLGNICRSPAAEAVLKKMVQDAGLSDQVEIASAGTSAYHSGNLPDSRMREHGQKRNFNLNSLSQKFIPVHFDHYDAIITMDRSNYQNVIEQTDDQKFISKVKPFSHYCSEHSITEVPDPYHGGDEGFRYVFDLMEDGCAEILRRIKNKEPIV